MKIGQLAARAGLNASAIRYYERLGLLPVPHRVNGQRRYSGEALSRVLLIHFAANMGFSLEEIRLFLAGLREDAPVGPRWRKLAHRKIAEVAESIKRLRRLNLLLHKLLRCRCASLQVCVASLSLSPNLPTLPRPGRQR